LDLDKSLLVLATELLDLVFPLLEGSEPNLDIFVIRGGFFPLVKVKGSLKVINFSASVESLHQIGKFVKVI